MSESTYKGPVFLVVHAPVGGESRRECYNTPRKIALAAANKKRITTALEKAAIRKIPVFYADTEQIVEEILGTLKCKPKVILLNMDLIQHEEKLRALAKREGIVPTKVIGFGALRENCVARGLECMGRVFPDAELHLIEGASTIYTMSGKRWRAAYHQLLEKSRITRSKKLTPRHMI
jgi:hypothetical protein